MFLWDRKKYIGGKWVNIALIRFEPLGYFVTFGDS